MSLLPRYQALNMIESSDGCNVNNSLELLDLNTSSGEPIQILVFPPKNKRFIVDEETKSLQIEPVQCPSTELEDICKAGEDCLNNEAGDDVIMHGSPVGGMEDITEEKCIQTLGNDKNYVEEILKIYKPFSVRNCFLKGCKWSPDGFCLLSNSEDNVLRLFEIPENNLECNTKEVLPVLVAKEGGTVYDYDWYPLMSSSYPETCVFATTSHNSPIHLWDAYTGMLRATYQPINQYDEVTAAYSLTFSPDGSKIYCGFKKFLRIFDVSLPGRKSQERNLKPKGSSVFQTNIISSISVNPIMPSVYALGSYDKTIGIYTEPEGELQCLLKGHKGGVTQIMFSKNGIELYSGGRKDSEIICWDLRNPGKNLLAFKRKVTTNQKIYFDLTDEGCLVTGSTDGNIIMYDTKRSKAVNGTGPEPNFQWKAHDDCVNGVHLHPNRDLMASSSGQFHLSYLSTNGEEDDQDTDEIINEENSLKIWRLNFNSLIQR